MDDILIKSRLANAEKQFGLGLIEHDELLKIRRQCEYALSQLPTPAATNESKHTPGPWRTDANDYFIFGGETPVAIICTSLRNNKKATHANAALIAAAPDLLEALEDLLLEFDYDVRGAEKSVVSARAAIARATQSKPTEVWPDVWSGKKIKNAC